MRKLLISLPALLFSALFGVSTAFAATAATGGGSMAGGASSVSPGHQMQSEMPGLNKEPGASGYTPGHQMNSGNDKYTVTFKMILIYYAALTLGGGYSCQRRLNYHPQ